MKSQELQILNRLNSYDKTLQLNPSEYEYCRFDAWSEKYIVEIKARNKYYKELMIEFDKYAFNSKYAENNGKEFLYINEMAGNIYIFNISQIDLKFHNYKWEWREMPKTSEFENKNKMPKYVGYIPIDFANFTFNEDYKRISIKGV